MFDKRFWITGAAVLAVAASAFFFAGAPEPREIAAADDAVSGIARDIPAQMDGQEEYAYYLREHKGRVAVFLAGEDDPQMELDVLVKYLPDYDREQMRNGIPVKDYEELQKLIEDYIS